MKRKENSFRKKKPANDFILSRATKLSVDLQKQKISDDPAFLHKLNQYVFKGYLKTYSK